MSPEVYSTYIIEDGEVNKEAMKENNLLDYEGQYSTSVQIKVLNVVVFKLFGATWWMYISVRKLWSLKHNLRYIYLKIQYEKIWIKVAIS